MLRLIHSHLNIMNPPTPPPPPAAPPKSSGTKWVLWGCGGCLVLAIILAVILGAGGYFGFQKLQEATKNSPAYQEALQRARNSPELQAELGTPIEEGAFSLGNISKTNGHTTIDLGFHVTGPKESAAVSGRAEYGENQPVQFQELRAQVGSKVINLLEPGEGGAAIPESMPEEEVPQDLEVPEEEALEESAQ